MKEKILRKYYEDKAKRLDELRLTYDNPSAYKRFFYMVRFNAVIDALNPRPKELILDLGCGTGYYTKEILRKGAKVIAVEYSSNYLNQARNFVGNNKNAKFIRSSATDLPFDNDTFNKVLFTEVIEHVPDYEKTLQEIKRVLKPKGIAVVTTPSRHSPMNMAYGLKRTIKGYRFNEHVREFSKPELINLLRKYFIIKGFKLVNYVLPYPVDSLVLGIKNDNHAIMRFVKNLETFFSKTPVLSRFGWTMVAVVEKKA